MFNGFDIFGVPLDYGSEVTRRRRFPSYVWKLSELLKVDITRTFHNSIYEIYNCVFLGFLSFQSASYFLLGRYNPTQDKYLRTFNDFLQSNQNFSLSKIHALWQGKQTIVPANTFQSPLVELASDLLSKYSFLEERSRYHSVNVHDSLDEYQRELFIDSFDDLPPDNAVMP